MRTRDAPVSCTGPALAASVCLGVDEVVLWIVVGHYYDDTHPLGASAMDSVLRFAAAARTMTSRPWRDQRVANTKTVLRFVVCWVACAFALMVICVVGHHLEPIDASLCGLPAYFVGLLMARPLRRQVRRRKRPPSGPPAFVGLLESPTIRSR